MTMKLNCIINKELLILKILYFFELSIVACIFIYITPFMSEWGVTATEMAIINVVANLLALFSRPLFGYIADRYQKYKQLLIILSLLCAIVYSLHLASPKHKGSSIYSLKTNYALNVSTEQNLLIIYTSSQLTNQCWPFTMSQCRLSNEDSHNLSISLDRADPFSASYVPSVVNFSFKSKPIAMWCTNLVSSCNTSDTPFTKTTKNSGLTWSSTFWILGIVKTIGYIVYSPLTSLTDAVTFVTLGPSKVHEFGFTRMFGTLGVLVVSIIMAFVLHVVNIVATANNSGWIWQMHQYSQFTPCFIIGGIIFFLLMVTASFLRIDKSIKMDNFIKSLNVFFRDWNIGVFFVFSILGGFLLQVFSEYFFLTLFQRHYALPIYFPGLIIVVMTVSESLVFGFSSLLLRHKNYEIWISLSFLVWAIRWCSYIFLDNFWLHLLIELLHGPSFGLMLACMMAHIGKLGTETTQGRIQGVFAGTFFNIGGAFGGFVGGLLLESFGMFGLFKVMACISLLCSSYYPLQRWVVRPLCNPKKSMEEFIKVDDDLHDNDTNKPLLIMNPVLA